MEIPWLSIFVEQVLLWWIVEQLDSHFNKLWIWQVSLNNVLRDCLVCGLRNIGIHKWLLSEVNLTLGKAGEIVQGIEAAEKNANRVWEEETVPINRVIPRREKTDVLVWRKQKKPCYHCRQSGQMPNVCWFRNATRHKCHTNNTLGCCSHCHGNHA